MDEYGTNPRNAGRLNRAQDRISQHGSTKPPALKVSIDGQSTNDHGRNRVGHVASHAARRSGVGHGAGCETIIGNHALPRFGANHIGPRTTARFVLQRATTKPVIQRRFPALEAAEVVVRANGFRRPQRTGSRLFFCRHRLSFPGGRRTQEPAQTRVVGRRLVKRRGKHGEILIRQREEAPVE